MAKSTSLLSILLPILFISFTSTNAFHVPGHYGFHTPILSSSYAAPLNILPELSLSSYQAISSYYPYPTLASPYIYNQLAGVSPYYYASQVLGTAPLLNQLQRNQVFNQLQANQLFQQQQANQAFNQLENNQLFSQIQANQLFNQQQANQLFINTQLANYHPLSNIAASYPAFSPVANPRLPRILV